jgi:MoaA/NifB/PqqE/SkfB family radical SAM enzyme
MHIAKKLVKRLIKDRPWRYTLRQNYNHLLSSVEIRAARSRLRSYPLLLNIVPTKRCNLSCVFCFFLRGQRGPDDMTLDTFNQIVTKIFPYPKVVEFSSAGEPFLNKNLMEFMAICKRYHVDNDINTNAMLLNEDICKWIVLHSRVTNLRISVDSAEKSTLESIRVGVDYDRVVSNIRLLAELKKKYRREYPVLHVTAAVFRRNIEELPDLIRHSKRWGIQRVSVGFVNLPEKMDKRESLFYHWDLTQQVFRESAAVALSEGIPLTLPSDSYVCNMPWRFVKIDPDGSVRFCFKSWDNPVGNILEAEDFHSVWNNIHYQLIRKTINTDKPYFRNCFVCPRRNGERHIAAHIKNEGRYGFDTGFEDSYGITVPETIVQTCE